MWNCFSRQLYQILGQNQVVEGMKIEPIVREASNEVKVDAADNGEVYNSKKVANIHLLGETANGIDRSGGYYLQVESLGSLDYDPRGFGSTRKEKDWNGTLACKLFEERHGRGMDSLWETYEMASDKADDPKIMKKKKKKKRKKREKEEREYYGDCYNGSDSEVEVMGGHWCCLQALKFGKMNGGMGRYNFVKILKVIKRIRWLNHVSSHAKKDHYGDDRFEGRIHL